MNAAAAPVDGHALAALFALFIAPLALAGVALINTGLGRSRSAAQSFLGSVLLSAVGVLSYVLTSGLWHQYALNPLTNFPMLSAHEQLSFLFALYGAGFAPLIPWGAGADRLRLTAGLLIAVVLGGVAVPLLTGAAWSNGWLAQLGSRYGLGDGFMDQAGSGVIQALGGLAALAMLWVTGARKGKFPKPGLATAIPGHQAVYVLLGGAVALVGWLGLNAAGAVLHGGVAAQALAAALVNTLLMAGSALLATFIATRIRFGKPDASLSVNGWLAGLVASSAGAAALTPLEAILIGAVAGFATPLLVEALELALSLDDPSGAIPVHFVAGVLGVFCAGVFSARPGQLIAQLVGVSTMLGLSLPGLYLCFLALNRVHGFRVDADGERLGMDMHELGGSAYPEFVIHRDDFYR